MRECPLCGETMRLVTREVKDRIPGHVGARPRSVREWVCPECDYFEEAESGEG
jgi:transposase